MLSRSVSRAILLTGTAGAVCALLPQAALAQSADAATGASERPEIIVTANKREERLLDVAGSIAVVDGSDIDQRQALDLQDLARSVAGLNLQQGATPGVNRIILRGLNAGGDGATVASVVDDAPLSFSGANTNGAFVASDFQTYDLQRVEVLRGPQGTLYGATSEGGLVRYVTNPADPSGFAAGAQVGGSTVAHGDADGFARAYLNLPLGENAAIRFTGFYDGIPGWGDNPQLGEEDINGGRRYGGRANLFFEPTEGLTITALALYQDGKFFGNGAVEANGFTDPTDPFGLVNGYTYRSATRNFATNKYQLYSLNVSLDVGFGTLQSITSYGEVDVTSFNDIQPFANALVPNSSVRSTNAVGLGKFTQEVRLASDTDSEGEGIRLDWQLGFFYTRESVDFLQDFEVLAQPSLTPLANFVTSSLPSRFEDVAGYANATLHFSDRFDIEFGLRVARNNQRSQLTQSGLAVGGATIVNPARTSAETATTFQVAPRFRINDDAMIYARVARGYRPGGPQIPVPGAPPTLPDSFGSDSTLNYEIGFKGALADKMLTVDVAAFYIDWSDVQVLTGVIVGGNQFTITGNVGKAVSKGFEWGFELRPTAGLTLSAIGAYTDATFTRAAPAIGALDGDRLPYVADLTSTIGFDYEAALSDSWDGFVAGSWTYTGDRVSDFPFKIELPSFSTFDAQLGVRSGKYSIELFGKNLSDERGITNFVPLGATGGVGTMGIIRPRTIGIRLAADFLNEAIKALDAIVDPADSTSAPGGVVAVRQRGRVVYRRGFGMASIEHAVANTPATRMRIGSSSKQFTCFAALLLAEEGKLDLDAPVDRWVPGLPGFPTVPTARQLMNHTGGYRDHLDAAGLANGGALIPDGWAMQMIARQTGANFAPGDGQTYCNAGYHLLSAVIERAAGERFEDFLDRRIFKPLGMLATASAPSDYAITPDLATLHVPTPAGGWRRGLFPTEEIRGEGAMISTVDDMLRWLDELKGPHRLASADGWRAMTDAPLLPDGTRSIYALGLHRHLYRGIEVIHHAGGVIGGAAQVMHVPAHDLDIVMLSNGGCLQPIPTVWRILETLLADDIGAPVPPLAAAGDFPALDGQFYAGASGTLVGFGIIGDILGLSFTGAPPYPILRDHGAALIVGFEESALGPIIIDKTGLTGSTPPETIAFSESGRRETLQRLAIDAARAARLRDALVGTYTSTDLEASATLVPGDPAGITVRGEFGQVTGLLQPLSEDFLLVTEEQAGPSSAVVQVERSGGTITGLRVSAPRGRGFLFERQG